MASTKFLSAKWPFDSGKWNFGETALAIKHPFGEITSAKWYTKIIYIVNFNQNGVRMGEFLNINEFEYITWTRAADSWKRNELGLG
ncbi:unnamed protein product [Rhizophagus irregularis]|nr:unnamed protein product [Rhizophagus irregularis]